MRIYSEITNMDPNLTVMVIEDDSVQQKLLDHILKSAGLKTVLASGGYDAIEKLKGKKPDLFLIDLHMPDMTGFQLLKILKGKPETEGIPVIMMSIDTSEESAILCVSSGANSYINKPIRISELFIKIRNVVGYEVPEEQYQTIYNTLKTDTVHGDGSMSADMVNYVLGSESFQMAKSICTFASILTVRVHGLLELVHKTPSEKIQEAYDEIISIIFEIIYRNRGAINSVFNDLVFCTFGIPVVYDNDTINSLVCADELLKVDLGKLRSLLEQDKKGLKLSISIMSGKVYLGAVRSMQNLNDSIMGNPLIRSLQIENSSVTGSGYHITIDSNTMDIVGDFVQCKPLEGFEDAGASHTQNLYQVLSINHEKISQIPNISKQYTPKDSVSADGYEKL